MHAFGLKKNRCGTPPVSKMADNEDATASLWDSEVLSVKDSVGPPIPEFSQRPEEGTKVPASPGGQDAWNVLPNDPARSEALGDPGKSEGQLTTRVIHASALSSDGEGLAWGASDEDVD